MTEPDLAKAHFPDRFEIKDNEISVVSRHILGFLTVMIRTL